MHESEIFKILSEEFYDKLQGLTDLVPRLVTLPDVSNKIKVAIGVRRSGKSYLLYEHILTQLQDKIPLSRILFLNFEDDRLLPLTAVKLANLVEAFYSYYPENHDVKCYLYLDEIQNVPDWSIVVRRLFDTKKVDIYLTGSSAKLLSKEIATSLRGRSLATEVWPYSLSEYLTSKKIVLAKSVFGKKAKDQFAGIFADYLKIGGFPEVIDYSPAIRQQTLQEYVDVVIYRDIIERYEIKDPALIKYMIISMIHNVAKPFTVNKFFNDVKSQGFKTSKDTLYAYLSYIEDAYLAFSVALYDKSIRKVQTNPKKIYAVDTGLIRAVTLSTNDFGRLFENIIYLDLRRRGYQIFYYLTQSRYEVDFLIIDFQGNKKLLQVVWNMDDEATALREQQALTQATEELKIPGMIITLESYLESFHRTGKDFHPFQESH